MQKIYCLELKTNKKRIIIDDFILQVKKELDVFFEIDGSIPCCFLIDSRKQFNEIQGLKTKDWQTAWAKDGNIFILKPEIFTKESSHKNPNDFWKIIKHEYAHIYYKQLSGGASKPKWLNEGLAAYLGGQSKEKPSKTIALDVVKYYEKSDQAIFPIGKYWVNYLIEKFGKKKLLDLIKSLRNNRTEKCFKYSFKKIYNFSFTEKELNIKYK